MDRVRLYQRFNAEFFYSFQKHSTDLEIEELARRYRICLDKNDDTLARILAGQQSPDTLRADARRALVFLAEAEAKFPIVPPESLRPEHFEAETQFRALPGQLRGLVGGQVHLVRLIKPAEYDRNYWFYSQGDHVPHNVFCSEFGLDLIEYLKAIGQVHRGKLANLRRALAFEENETPSFWTLGPYLHQALLERGLSWSESLTCLLRLAGRHFAHSGRPFAGVVHFPLGYDERMPTHLLARLEAMRDIRLLESGAYADPLGLRLPG